MIDNPAAFKTTRLCTSPRLLLQPRPHCDNVEMRGVAHPSDPAMAAQDVVFTIVNGNERQRIEVSADGGFDVPLLATNAPVTPSEMPASVDFLSD